MRLAIWVAVGLTACSGGSETTEQPVTNTDDPGTVPTEVEQPCDAIILTVEPAPRAEDVALDSEVTVTFSEAVGDGDWFLAVYDAVGVATLAADGMSATWVAETELEPSTSYTIEAEVCDESMSTTFETTLGPVPIEDIEGVTYSVLWDDLTFTEPPNGGVLFQFLTIDAVLLQFEAIDPATSDVDLAATLEIDGAPFCASVVRETGDLSGNPELTFGPQTVTIPIFIDGDGTVTQSTDVEGLTITGNVAADGGSLQDIELRGLIAVEDLIGDPCPKNSLVTLAMGTCEPCTVSKSGSCMLLEANTATADEDLKIDLTKDCPVK